MSRGRRCLWAVLILMSLAACTQTVWYREGATLNEFSQDQVACAGDPAKKYPSSGFSGAANFDRSYIPCMEARGWQLTHRTYTAGHCPLPWPSSCDDPFLDRCPSCQQ